MIFAFEDECANFIMIDEWRLKIERDRNYIPAAAEALTRPAVG